MTVQDHYRIVSSVIRIANDAGHSHEERLKDILHLVAESLRCASATFYLADGEARILFRKISTLLPDADHPCHIPFGKGVAGKCAASARPLHRGISSLHADESFIGNERQISAFPVMDREHPLGVLTMGLTGDTRMGDDESELLQVILLAAAGLIRCIQHVEETNKRLRELSFLYRISNSMLSTIRINRLIHLILSSLTSGPSPLFDRAMLFLANERAAVLQGMMGVTREEEGSEALAEEEAESDFCTLVKATRLPFDRNLNTISCAILDKRLILVRNPARETPVDRGFLRRFGSTPHAVAPLIARERLVGAIVVDNRLSSRPITPDDLHLVQLFTNQAAMAVENSILYHRLEDTNRNLKEAQELLLQGEKLAAIGKMAAGIAHEIKNPLVSVGGFAGRLKKKLPPDSEEWQHADLILREVQHLEKLLTDILFFAKKTTICYTRCTINQIVEDALAVVAIPLEEKRVRVEMNLATRLPSIQGDCQQLRHVFINLFGNAHEVMEHGGVLSIETFPSRIEGRRAVSVRVSDTGGGIPPDVIHAIFTPFFTTKQTGTGLGLAIAHRIISNHCGKIEGGNREEGGAEFTVTIPISP